MSLPFAVYGGVAATDAEASAGAASRPPSSSASELGVQHLELRNRVAMQPDWPRQELYVTFRKTLPADVEANMLAIPRKQRAMVRKGIQRELRSEIDADVERFFELYADNQHRHGTPPHSRATFARCGACSATTAKCSPCSAPTGRPCRA